MLTIVGSWQDEVVTVVEVMPALYRVLKSNPQPGEPPLLGFVRSFDGSFETTALGHPFSRFYWATMAEAVDSLCRVAGIRAADQLSNDVPETSAAA